MTSLGMRALLVAASLLGVAAAVLGLTMPLTATESAVVMNLEDDAPSGKSMTASKLGSLVRLVILRTPFRASRKPAMVAFDPNPPAPAAASTAAKPVLALSGIVWSGDPTAVIQGLPGIEGSKVVRRGDVVAGFRISRIDRDRVWVTGFDTTWTLAVREPWK